MKNPRIAVLGSVHMDLIARAHALPDKGTSIVGHGFSMHQAARAAIRPVNVPRWVLKRL